MMYFLYVVDGKIQGYNMQFIMIKDELINLRLVRKIFVEQSYLVVMFSPEHVLRFLWRSKEEARSQFAALKMAISEMQKNGI